MTYLAVPLDERPSIPAGLFHSKKVFVGNLQTCISRLIRQFNK